LGEGVVDVPKAAKLSLNEHQLGFGAVKARLAMHDDGDRLEKIHLGHFLGRGLIMRRPLAPVASIKSR